MLKLSEQQRAFTKDIALLMQYSFSVGIEITFGEAYRTKEQQNIHLKNKRTKVKYSRHMDRLAMDFNFFIDGKYVFEKSKLQKLGDFWESLNPLNKWGGNWTSFKDTPHFERKKV